MNYNKEQIKLIGFDADDTLWPLQPFFDKVEDWFHQTVNTPKLKKKLFETQIRNLSIYGFGVKGFTLSMIEAFLNEETGNAGEIIQEILDKGKELLSHPINVYPGVSEVLKKLKKNYKLAVITKGDLLDQARKIEKSELKDYFDFIKIMPDKKPENYIQFLDEQGIHVSEFLMIGNSMGSDIAPIIELGGNAVHVPAESTWEYDNKLNGEYDERCFHRIGSISELFDIVEV